MLTLSIIPMKNLAKLVLFFSLTFTILLLAGILLGLLSNRVDLTRIVPVEAIPGEDAVKAAWKAFPAALYLAILLSLSYTARRKMPVPVTIVMVAILGAAFTLAVSLGMRRSEALQPVLKSVNPVRAGPGLILSRSDNAMILLRESSFVRGPRVVSIPGRTLIYQEVPLGPNSSILSLPALPFGGEVPWFIQSVGIDFSLSARELETRLETDFISFAAYALSLILLLGSMRFILGLSQWPLANLFLGALIFRGVLALETFLNAREINALVGSFLKEQAPPSFITPLVFCTLSILILLYTLLAHIARPRRRLDD